MTVVYLGLGTNLGDRSANIRRALAMLTKHAVVEEVSSLYETDPVGYKDQPKFLNAVCRISTKLRSQQLLIEIKAIETAMGRESSFRNAPRIIDIDILLFDDVVENTDILIIPHPRLHQRAFVLVPLAEIAPEVVHPVLGKTIISLLGETGTAGVTEYAEKITL